MRLVTVLQQVMEHEGSLAASRSADIGVAP
jgi:hypothetical protein